MFMMSSDRQTLVHFACPMTSETHDLPPQIPETQVAPCGTYPCDSDAADFQLHKLINLFSP